MPDLKHGDRRILHVTQAGQQRDLAVTVDNEMQGSTVCTVRVDGQRFVATCFKSQLKEAK